MKTTYCLWLSVLALSATTLTNITLPKVHTEITSVKGPGDTIANPYLQGAVKGIKPITKHISYFFLQDIRMYNISGTQRIVMSYIPEPAASKVGYMGFKVGDKVKWDSPIDRQAQGINGVYQSFLTGTINMLDSDKCYISVENSTRVAVKPYEDIEKVNP